MGLPGSFGVLALVVALFSGCGMCALAERAFATLDDSVSLMQITRHFSAELLKADKVCPPVRLTAADRAASDNFGRSVAISDGMHVAVGATGDDDQGSDSGSVYVFNFATGEQLIKLTASDGTPGDSFGSSVSISSDGTRVAVGASGAGANNTGSAYLFDVATGSELLKLTAPIGTQDGRFGRSVSISADGASIAVGAHDDDGKGSGSGSVYVFNATTGGQLAKLTAPDGAPPDFFGDPVSISSGGARVAVGAPYAGNGSFPGSAYVFDVANGTKLVSLRAPDGAALDHFGGAVFDVATGAQLLNLTVPDGVSSDNFGYAVAITPDGGSVAVGARWTGPAGMADVFNVTAGNELGIVAAPVGLSWNSSGRSMSITSNGLRVAVGDYLDDDGAGSAYVFDVFCPTPVPPAASATGDPHVTNVDGTRFDIMKIGVHEFLRLPRRSNQSRGSLEPEPSLSVLAAVERADQDECHESYVKQVDVTGGWLNSSGLLRFRAVGDSLETSRAIFLSVNGSLVDAQSLGRDSRVRSFLEVTEPRTPRASQASSTIQKLPMLTVKLSFEAATLKIDWMHRTVPGRPSLNHLNFQAFGLRRFMDGAGMDIGGILGRDDHSDAASSPHECRHSSADLRATSSAPGEESDPHVISAAL